MQKKGTQMVYPKEAESKLKDANRKLRAQIKRQKNEIIQLQKRIDQYEKAFAKNFDHITDMMGDWSVEDAIRFTKKKPTKPKPETVDTVKKKFKEMFSKRTEDD